MIEVVKAPPFATVQDLGWRTGRAMGLPQSGAMDRSLLMEANAAVGNPPDAAALEWALGPGTLRFVRGAVVCAHEDAEVRIDGVPHGRGAMSAAARAVRVEAGATLEIVPGKCDRFVYLAVRGGIDVPPVLGSRSTYLPGGLGGYQGRRLQRGDRLPIGAAPVSPPARRPQTAGSAHPPGEPVILRATRGPQWGRFDAAAHAAFFAGAYTVTPASDRMGYRLSGPVVQPRETATLPSEAACPGAVQIPDGGQPIVLMPDGPTVGGYPKIAVLLSDDVAVLAQCQPGCVVRFRELSIEAARAARRREELS